MGKIKGITIAEVEFLAYQLVKETMLWDEPVPDFTSRYPNILESCLIVPFQKFSNKNLYKGLLEKASILFYLMIKNHPFQNGNKRIAMSALFIFLLLNNKWLKVDNRALYEFAVLVAKSPPETKDGIVLAIENFIKKHLIDFSK